MASCMEFGQLFPWALTKPSAYLSVTMSSLDTILSCGIIRPATASTSSVFPGVPTPPDSLQKCCKKLDYSRVVSTIFRFGQNLRLLTRHVDALTTQGKYQLTYFCADKEMTRWFLLPGRHSRTGKLLEA